MISSSSAKIDDWLNLIDLNAIADPCDKISECEYFFGLASQEKDKDKFRWLISAFFGAAYSFFEIQALRAYHDFNNPQTGEPIENSEALAMLNRFVCIEQSKKNPHFVKTSCKHEITKQLYELRKGNTHHYPLSIMTKNQELPYDFEFGYLTNQGVPALAFCREILSLIQKLERALQECY